MRELLKLITCEFQKMKRKKLLQTAFLTTFIMPLFYSLLLSDWTMDDMISVILTDNSFLLLIPLSVVIAASLFFQEHDYDTLKNLMCIPVTKGQLAVAKLFVLLLFDIAYELTGYGFAVLMCVLNGVPLEHWGLQLLLILASGVLIWAAAMPCILLVVWCNKSYIISVILAFTYAGLNYILRINDAFLLVPLGLNLATFLPVPMIFRWQYQFHPLENATQTFLDFYQRFSPYFVPTPAVFCVLISEALVCILLLIRIYQKQNV